MSIASYAATGLPAGLTLDTTTGVISGTPTGPAGTTAVTVTATDDDGATCQQTFNWTVNPGAAPPPVGGLRWFTTTDNAPGGIGVAAFGGAGVPVHGSSVTDNPSTTNDTFSTSAHTSDGSVQTTPQATTTAPATMTGAPAGWTIDSTPPGASIHLRRNGVTPAPGTYTISIVVSTAETGTETHTFTLTV